MPQPTLRSAPDSLIADAHDAAWTVARAIVHEAVWDGRACSWPVEATAPSGPLMDGSLYQGSAGVAVFLAEVAARRTGDGPDIGRLADTALGALRYAVQSDVPAAHPFGAYAGPLGVVYAAARVARALDAPEVREMALTHLDSHVPDRATPDADLSVIGGLAGAAPVLLALADLLETPECIDRAVQVGDALLQAAHAGPVGWWWDTLAYSAVRPVCGLSHGAAGVAWALAELYAATGEGAFRYAAEQAMAYEDAHLNRATGNWSDLRYVALGNYLRQVPPKAQTDPRVQVPPYRASSIAFWCHGAPGIVLTRMRIRRLLGSTSGADCIPAALASVARSLDTLDRGTSLCHGAAGNAEVLRVCAAMDRADGRPSGPWADRPAAVARAFIRDVEAGRPWRSGHKDGAPNRSLLMGDAGVGLFLLRWAHPSVLDVLLPAPGGASAAPRRRRDPRPKSTTEAARDWSVNALFGRTRAAAQRLLQRDVLAPGAGGESAERAPVEAAAAIVTQRTAESGRTAALLADAARPEMRAYRRSVALHEAEEGRAPFLRWAAWHRTRPLPTVSTSVQRAPHVDLVHQAYDWEAPSGDGRPEGEPPRSAVVSAVYQEGHGIAVRRLHPLAAAVLTVCASPVPLGDLVATVSSEQDGPATDVQKRVLLVVRRLWTAGFLEPVQHKQQADDPLSG